MNKTNPDFIMEAVALNLYKAITPVVIFEDDETVILKKFLDNEQVKVYVFNDMEENIITIMGLVVAADKTDEYMFMGGEAFKEFMINQNIDYRTIKRKKENDKVYISTLLHSLKDVDKCNLQAGEI